MLVVPTPCGEPFTQAARRRARRPRAGWCSPAAATRASTSGCSTRPPTGCRVREVSVGDYVLNGGEVAALVVIEAVVRLLPGFMGNPESLAEESHGDGGLLEYPVYTKPASWRGLDVPPVLLSGDHARIAAWRHDQAVRRTADRRPDLLHPSRDADRRRIEDARGAHRDAGRRRRAAHAPAGLLGAGGAGQPRRWTSRRSREDLDDVRGLARRVDHARRTLRAAAGRRGARPARRATPGTSAG